MEQMKVKLVESGVRFHFEKGSPGDLGLRICSMHRLPDFKDPNRTNGTEWLSALISL